MIIVHTNVISEVLRINRSEAAVAWLDEQMVETLFLASTSVAELALGLECLPAGKRKTALSNGVNKIMSVYFANRILPFDREAALAYGRLVASARSAGFAISVADGQIGAIASVRNVSVATRDVRPFKNLGISVINPWLPVR